MAKQNLSKKGVSRFLKKKVPKNERTRKYGPQAPANGVRPPPPRKSKQHAGERRNHGVRKKKSGAGAGGLPQGYTPQQRILLVGEGNLSMARALVRLFDGDGSNLVATTFDNEEALREARGARARAARQACAARAVLGTGGRRLHAAVAPTAADDCACTLRRTSAARAEVR
jgi:hypothetical protein